LFKCNLVEAYRIKNVVQHFYFKNCFKPLQNRESNNRFRVIRLNVRLSKTKIAGRLRYIGFYGYCNKLESHTSNNC
jgi:hypothetical protein